MALTSELITTYASLQTQIENWLNREDQSDNIPTFIQLAEQTLSRDIRVRKLQDRGTFTINADGDALPSDFDSMEDWYLDGPTYYGSIELVPAAVIPAYRAAYGTTGVPRVAANVENVLRYGPQPDQAYDSKMTYWRKIAELSSSQTTNWLLLDSPDVYLFASLVEAEPFLKNDDRVQLWKGKLDEALEGIEDETERRQFSGPLRGRRLPRRIIGG